MAKPKDFAKHAAKLISLKWYQQPFIIHPRHLDGLKLPIKIVWKKVPFKKANLSLIEQKPGVYAFVVASSHVSVPAHGYILYIGITKGLTAVRTLRTRAKEYFVEKRSGKRAHVQLFLKKWQSCLYFHYAPLDPKLVNLHDVERRLNDAFMPPYSIQDFSPEIRKGKRLIDMS